MFSIKFDCHPIKAKPQELMPGRLIAGSLDEAFQSTIGYWSVEDYCRQWAYALDLIIGGGLRSALITSIENPRRSGAVDWWPIFREGDTIYIRFQLLILAQCPGNFNPYGFDDLLRPRDEFDEDGNHLSEWSFSLNDLIEFRRKSTFL